MPLYLPMEETSVLHSAVWLIQLLVGVAHIFVPEARLLLCWDLKQRPHLLLYRICREAEDPVMTQRATFGGVQAFTRGPAPHRWYQLC